MSTQTLIPEYMTKIGALFVLICSLSACETVANVAQGVADSARGRASSPTAQADSRSTPASATPTVPVSTGQPPTTTNQGGSSTCAKNFAVTGSFFSGKQMRAASSLPNVAPDLAYKKAYAEVVKRGWQIVQADKDMRMISANQNVSYSKGGKTVPINVMIEAEKGGGKGSNIILTLNIPGGLMAPEDAVRDDFCAIAQTVAD